MLLLKRFLAILHFKLFDIKIYLLILITFVHILFHISLLMIVFQLFSFSFDYLVITYRLLIFKLFDSLQYIWTLSIVLNLSLYVSYNKQVNISYRIIHYHSLINKLLVYSILL